MTKAPINVQDQFLNQVRREKIAVTIDLASGKSVKGTVRSFDNFCVIIEGQGQQLIYKHAISSIYPTERNVRLSAFNEGHGGHTLERRGMDRRPAYTGGHAATAPDAGSAGPSAGEVGHEAPAAESNGPAGKL
jgi:host factor-I protein